jgi:thiol-disulfide isomerase/thioredoxin
MLAVAVVALLRQIGVLHQRLAPMGTHFASEGPALDAAAPAVGLDWSVSALTVLLFTSPTCVLCRELKPSLDAFRRQYRELRVHTVDLEQDPAVFDAMAVRSTPYVVAVDGSGVVRGRGVANSLEQIEELVREAQLATLASPVRS